MNAIIDKKQRKSLGISQETATMLNNIIFRTEDFDNKTFSQRFDHIEQRVANRIEYCSWIILEEWEVA